MHHTLSVPLATCLVSFLLSSMMCFDAIVSSVLSSIFRALFRRSFMAFLGRCRWPISVHRYLLGQQTFVCFLFWTIFYI